MRFDRLVLIFILLVLPVALWPGSTSYDGAKFTLLALAGACWLGSLAWHYSGTMFTEPLATLLVLYGFHKLASRDPRFGEVPATSGLPALTLAGLALGLAVATHVGQILLAVTTFSVVSAAPAIMPWTLGFAVGSLLQLVLMELLPESYRQAGQTSIAMVTVVTLGVVVLARSLIA